jgi:tRNA(Ile)-lysidine synthase TilS/MesJ
MGADTLSFATSAVAARRSLFCSAKQCFTVVVCFFALILQGQALDMYTASARRTMCAWNGELSGLMRQHGCQRQSVRLRRLDMAFQRTSTSRPFTFNQLALNTRGTPLLPYSKAFTSSTTLLSAPVPEQEHESFVSGLALSKADSRSAIATDVHKDSKLPNKLDTGLSNSLITGAIMETFSQEIFPFVHAEHNEKIWQSQSINMSQNDRTHSQAEASFQIHPVTHPVILVLSVSGGCDSVALFHAIMSVLDRRIVEGEGDGGAETSTNTSSMASPNFEMQLGSNDNDNKANNAISVIPVDVRVVHFDHEQRGEENSACDRKFVEGLCQQYQVPCHVVSWSQSQSKKSQSRLVNDDATDSDSCSDSVSTSFSQRSARDWRQSETVQFVGCIQAQYQDRKTEQLNHSSGANTNTTHTPNTTPPGIILTAHHSDDNDETILMKLLRGVHITQIRGIGMIRPASSSRGQDERSISIARPLLRVTKRELQQYLIDNHWEWREDESNSSNKYKRNRIRNELLPLLGDIVGGTTVLKVSTCTCCTC